MWFYCVIVAVSLTSTVPLPHWLAGDDAQTLTCDFDHGLGAVSAACRARYSLFLALFALCMGVLVTSNLSEQAGIQMALSVFGSSCIFLMVRVLINLADFAQQSCYMNPSTKWFVVHPR
jgi:hypothetical protein